MATVTASGFGGFDAALFREKIIATMTMGMPNTVSDQATFYWEREVTFSNTDVTGKPYFLDDTPATDSTRPEIIVPVAVEFVSNSGLASSTTQNDVGTFDTSNAIITVLDTYYGDVYDADWVTLGGQIYDIKYWEPPVGLFEVDIHRVHVAARDLPSIGSV